MPKWISPDNVNLWENCKTPDCEYKSCGPLDSEYCFTCTIRIRKITGEEGRRLIKKAREEAFGVGCDD